MHSRNVVEKACRLKQETQSVCEIAASARIEAKSDLFPVHNVRQCDRMRVDRHIWSNS